MSYFRHENLLIEHFKILQRTGLGSDDVKVKTRLNIIHEDDAYCHVDLLRSEELGEFRKYVDSQMSGYVWDYSAYPAPGTAVE